MPFASLSNFELLLENEPTRNVVLEKLENNGFNTFLREYRNETDTENNTTIDRQYFDTDELNTLASKEHPHTSIIHMNIRRLAKNKGNFLGLLSTLNLEFDIIILTEVGDDAEHYINDNFLPNYDAFLDTPRGNKYGGTAILVKEGYGSATIRDDLKMTKSCTCPNCVFENTWVEIKSKGDALVIAAVYRHPNGDVGHFVTDMDNALSHIPKHTNCFLVGDMNIDLLKFENDMTFNYYSTLSEHNFMPYISVPTRITDYSATLIDHVFVKLNDKRRKSKITTGNILTDVTDHLPNFLLLSDIPTSKRNHRPLIRIFSERNINKFNEALSALNWNELLIENSATDACDIFYNHITDVFESSFPRIRLSNKRANDKKWMTSELRKCIQDKNRLYKKRLRNPTPQNIENYKKYRNYVNSRIKDAENEYYITLLSDQRRGITNFWKTYSQTMNIKKKKNKQRLSKIICDGVELTDDKEIADGLNNYFCKVGKHIASGTKTQPGQFHRYLRDKVNQTFFLAPAIEEEVYRELMSQNPRKSCGPDQITPKLIKQSAVQLTIPLTIIFNKAIVSATYPNPWKIAKVLALYKKNSRYIPDNYRPISLLNCLGKIFEKLIYNQMISFIEKHKIIYIYQYGFRRKHSTTLALIDVIDKIRYFLDKNEYVLEVFLDITKAFDSVNHDILCEKLDHYGFRGHAQEFLRSYLSDRRQFVTIQETESDIQQITYGVPQGSILGPLLFLIYINDIQNCVSCSDLRLFADDTAIFFHGSNPDQIIANTNNEMKNVIEWYQANKLKLSLGKSNFVLYHGFKKNPRRDISEIRIGNDSIPRSTCTKYIGLTIDEKLTWENHINEVCNSLLKYFGIFYNIRNSIPLAMARTIYYACIYSRIKYAIEIYGTASETRFGRLLTLQNKLMKLLTRKDRMFSTNTLHTQLKILKVKHIHETSVLHFVHNCIKGDPIDPFKRYFTYRHEAHNYELRNNDNISTRKININMGKNTTHHTGAILWNNLPKEITNIEELSDFKIELLAYYQDSYTDDRNA